ncbi:MAG: hypothetical protein IPG73_11950 [Ignavibacteria bacterium]|nr:hypothetical protein [Ignavibacteria bacterium]
MQSNPAFQIGQQRFDEIMSRTDLETNKQRDVMEYAMQSVPDLLVGLPDLDGTILREFVYMYGRLLDQDIMLTLSVIIPANSAPASSTRSAVTSSTAPSPPTAP